MESKTLKIFESKISCIHLVESLGLLLVGLKNGTVCWMVLETGQEGKKSSRVFQQWITAMDHYISSEDTNRSTIVIAGQCGTVSVWSVVLLSSSRMWDLQIEKVLAPSGVGFPVTNVLNTQNFVASCDKKWGTGGLSVWFKSHLNRTELSQTQRLPLGREVWCMAYWKEKYIICGGQLLLKIVDVSQNTSGFPTVDIELRDGHCITHCEALESKNVIVLFSDRKGIFVLNSNFQLTCVISNTKEVVIHAKLFGDHNDCMMFYVTNRGQISKVNLKEWEEIDDEPLKPEIVLSEKFQHHCGNLFQVNSCGNWILVDSRDLKSIRFFHPPSDSKLKR